MAVPFVRKYSIIEVIVVVVLAVPLTFILIDAVTHWDHRRTSRQIHDLSNVKQIGIGIVSYEQDNQGYGPGLDSRGKKRYAAVEDRYTILAESQYIDAEVFISIFDEDKVEWRHGPVSSENYSYSMLQLSDGSARLSSWNERAAGFEAVWLSGRNTDADADADAESEVGSIQLEKLGQWNGPVLWSDGHATREDDQFVDTRYQEDAPLNVDDNLFEADGDDDASMIYEGD